MPQPLTLDQQAGLIRRWDRRAKVWFETISGQRQLWVETTLQPTPTSGEYRVRLIYAQRVRPHLYVIDPEPVSEAHGIRTPHLNLDRTLCLYDAANGQWSPSDPIAYTVLQWASRWLFHYEHWLAFGEWRGDHDVVVMVKAPDAAPAPGLEKT